MREKDLINLFFNGYPFITSSSSTGAFDNYLGNYLETDYTIDETKDGAYVSFDVPGFTRDNLEISIEDRVVKIKGERVVNKKGEVKKILHKYKVDSNFNESNIEATVSNGILTLFLPNYIAKPKKTITIN
jgi:HSP20 family molecular chaperone IbpA